MNVLAATVVSAVELGCCQNSTTIRMLLAAIRMPDLKPDLATKIDRQILFHETQIGAAESTNRANLEC